MLFDLRSSRAVAEYIREKGGIPVRERVGHSFMKATLREKDAVFGGELAGHYYFRDNYYADCSLMAVIEILNLRWKEGKPTSEIVRPLSATPRARRPTSSSRTRTAKMREIAGALHATARSTGSTASPCNTPTGGSTSGRRNTEPYLRLVMEAKDEESLKRHMEELVPLLGEPAE